MEKKKKKTAALIEIAKLNAHDRSLKTSVRLQSEAVIDSMQGLKEPSPKRLRTENDCNGTTNG